MSTFACASNRLCEVLSPVVCDWSSTTFTAQEFLRVLWMKSAHLIDWTLISQILSQYFLFRIKKLFKNDIKSLYKSCRNKSSIFFSYSYREIFLRNDDFIVRDRLHDESFIICKRVPIFSCVSPRSYNSIVQNTIVETHLEGKASYCVMHRLSWALSNRFRFTASSSVKSRM